MACSTAPGTEREGCGAHENGRAARWVHKNLRRYFTPEAQPHGGPPNIIEESFQAFSLVGS
jgi:hypothetical protein